MKRKGFTLIEMMAVIAILGILVLLVLPNILKTYRNSKKMAFIDEAKVVYSKVTDDFVLNKTKGKRVNYVSNEEGNHYTLDIQNEKDLKYTIALNNKGVVTAFLLKNTEFCIVGVGDFLSDYTIDQVIDLKDNGNGVDEEETKKCVVEVFQDGTEAYLDLVNKISDSDEGATLAKPDLLTLKYGSGWYDRETKIPLSPNGEDIVISLPTKPNNYYTGSKTDDINVISCNGTLLIDDQGNTKDLQKFFSKSELRKKAVSEFKTKYYRVKFQLNGGSSNIDTIKCDYGKVCLIPNDVPSKSGYDFKGWRFNNKTYSTGDPITDEPITDKNEDKYPYFKFYANEVCINGEVKDAEAKQFEAVWDGINYSIAYDGNNATGGSMSNSIHKYDEEKALNKNKYTRIGYDFLGWSLDKNAKNETYEDEQVVKNLSSSSGSLVTLYAIWKPRSTTVVFNKNSTDSDTTTVSQSFTYGVSGNRFGYKTNGTPNWPQTGQFGQWNKTGYTLLGWNTNRSAATQTYIPYWEVSGSFIDSNAGKTVDLFAIWKPNIYTIKLDKKGGSGGTDLIYEKYENGYYLNNTATNAKKMSTSANGITVPTKTNYLFAGYIADTDTQYIGKSGKLTIRASNTKFSSNGSLYAKWCNACASVDNGQCVAKVSESGDCSYKTTCNTGYEVNNDGEYNATCTPMSYDISYEYNGGKAPSSGVPSSYTYGVGATINGEPKKDGYTFNGWDAVGGSTEPKFEKTIGPKETGDRKYSALWCQNCANVNNGKCILKVTPAGTCTYTAECNKGYTLSSGGGTRTPVCTANKYTIAYEYDGGKAGKLAPKQGTFDAVLEIDPPTKVGYRFNGWKASNLDTDTAKHGSTNNPTKKWNGTSSTTDKYFKNLRSSSGTVTLTATWKANRAYIYYSALNNKSNDVSVITKSSVNFERLNGDLTPSRDAGYIFYYKLQTVNELSGLPTGTYRNIVYRKAPVDYDQTPSSEFCQFNDSLTYNDYSPFYSYALYGEIVGDFHKNALSAPLHPKGGLNILRKGYMVTRSSEIKIGDKVVGYEGYEYRCVAGDCSNSTTFKCPDESDSNNRCLYNERKLYNANEFCDSSKGDCSVVLEVVWKKCGDDEIPRPYECVNKNLSFKVKYEANGGTGLMIDDIFVLGESKALKDNVFKRCGYTFNGWNTKADGTGIPYVENTNIMFVNVTGPSITLYAQWKKN